MHTFGLNGYGNLGVRHIQSIELFADKQNIYIYDPFKDDIPYAELTNDINIDYFVDASTIEGRLAALKNFVPHVKKVALLEKPLANSEVNFLEIFDVLKGKPFSTQVILLNCARRAWPLYQKIFKKHAGDIVEIEVCGNPDHASNFLHFADLALWAKFGDVQDVSVASYRVWEHDRRAGAYGLDLEAVITYDKNKKLVLSDGAGQVIKITLDDGKVITVDEGNHTFNDGSGLKSFAPGYQSRITYWTLTRGVSFFQNAVTYEDACATHLKLLSLVSFPQNKKKEYLFT